MVEYVGTRHQRARAARRAARAEEPLLRRLDWWLLAAVAGAVAYGLWAIAGITRHDIAGDPNYYVIRQGVYAAVGGLGLVGALLVDPSFYRRYWRALFGGTVGLMVLVILSGAATRGSKRWIDVGFFRFQPSEFGKLLFVLALAGFLAERARRIGEPRTTLLALGLALVPIFLVFVQPDLGTALVYGAALAAILFVAGTPWTHIAVLGVGAVLFATAVLWVLPAAGIQVLKPYQVHRLTHFMNPSSDPQGATYNITQSITTVGAGGVHGRGVAGSTQTNLDYLPEHRTDFAFASLAEQRGFLGASLLLLLYLLIIWRGLKIITVARDAFS
ncbi:MAG TPA: FtsW/RodA/SpoVE family cell cycle protein, partial [Gaiellaceae bacterium]|nr:FtsW/RodA/SpoVE family cell cycle protein [Gaiellaceae bacterium]